MCVLALLLVDQTAALRYAHLRLLEAVESAGVRASARATRTAAHMIDDHSRALCARHRRERLVIAATAAVVVVVARVMMRSSGRRCGEMIHAQIKGRGRREGRRARVVVE